MSSALLPCSGVGQPESGAVADAAEILAGLCERVATLERRLIKKRPDTNARRMTRPDRCPFGWRPGRDSRVLIQDADEQRIIFRLVELAQDPKASYRELARRLDALGCKRRGGKNWGGAHGLVRAILRRENVLSAEDARVAVQRRIEETKRRAGDKYRPEILTDAEARARARGERLECGR